VTDVDTLPLRNAYDALLTAASTVAEHPDGAAAPAPGEWDADRILAHVALVDAATIAAASAVAAGTNATFDNRMSLDPWTIDRARELAGGNAGLRHRIRAQGAALCTLGAEVLSEAELDHPVPTLLLSGSTLLVDQPVPLRALVAGLADDHLPRHTDQLLALLPEGPGLPAQNRTVANDPT
jgi:hypothetical protein